MLLSWLDQQECQEISRTGGKAANLSQLAAEHPVPSGFCLTTDAYRQWSAMTTPDAIPDDLYEIVGTNYQELAKRTQSENPSVAVRSSALGEDSQEASFAGQYETYLNRVGVEAVVEAIARCWSTAQTERIQIYRQQQLQRPEEMPLAVLVQWQVPADSSFVAFSVNPVNGQHTEVMIDANFGLGESIVSGMAAPDNYIVQKSDWHLSKQTIGEKRVMTVLADGGVKTAKVPRILSRQFAIEEEQVVEIAQLAVRLEKRFGWPVDIEGAYHQDQIYLLQCRPVSTLG